MNFSRNIGLITEEQQSLLNSGRVLICGVGGMGGVCAEALVRMGIGFLRLVDNDKFENTNSNRQIYSNTQSVGRFKAEVLKEQFLLINPNLKIEIICEPLSLQNVDTVIKDIDVVVNGMDQMDASLILERTARKKSLTVVDAWITPFASVFVTEPSSPHWEEFLNLPSKNIPPENFSKQLMKENLEKEVEYTFSHFNPYDRVDRKLIREIIDGEKTRPSFVIVVWLSGIFMANETFKVLTKQPNVGHKGFFFDQYTFNKMPGK